MNLDRHNYEEFFILYMDNELSPAERRQVEAFVVLHPDLKEELDLLMQFKLQPDESIVFDAKDELLKDVNVPAVNGSNYKGWLMLYLDNELSSTDRKLVEEFIAIHPAAQTDWSLLEKTKLQAETVIFAGKSLLYRTEKVRRIPVRWFRVAAAAVLLLGIGLSTAIVVNKKPAADKSFANTNPNTKIINPPANLPEQREELVADNSKVIIKPEERKVAENKKQENIVETKKQALFIPANNEELIAKKENEIPNNNLPKPVENPYLKPKNTTNVVATASPSDKIKLAQPLTVSDVTKVSTPPYIMYASNPETDNELDQADGKKTKWRGFFRKVTRTFEKRTNIASADDENKLLVAGLAFKLK